MRMAENRTCSDCLWVFMQRSNAALLWVAHEQRKCARGEGGDGHGPSTQYSLYSTVIALPTSLQTHSGTRPPSAHSWVASHFQGALTPPYTPYSLVGHNRLTSPTCGSSQLVDRCIFRQVVLQFRSTLQCSSRVILQPYKPNRVILQPYKPSRVSL